MLQGCSKTRILVLFFMYFFSVIRIHAQQVKIGVGAPGSDFSKDTVVSRSFFEHRFAPKKETAIAYTPSGKSYKLKKSDVIQLAEADRGSWNRHSGIWIKFYTVNNGIHAPDNDTRGYVLLNDMEDVESRFAQSTPEEYKDPIPQSTYQMRQTLVFGGLILVVVSVVTIFIMRSVRRIRKATREAAALKAKEDAFVVELAQLNNYIFDQLNLLGGTVEQRKKGINELFERNTAIMRFRQYFRVNNTRTLKPLRISRSLMTMEPKEREFLRAAMLLFNDGVCTEREYRYFLFSFVHGDGKASLDNEMVSDSTSKLMNGVVETNMPKIYQEKNEANISSAVNNVLKILADPERRKGHERIIDEINGRLSGGTAWLSATEASHSIFGKPSRYSLELGYLEQGGPLLTYSGEGSLITIAPPGSGKTQCLVLPNMLQWKGAALVLDVKGEIYAATHKWRRKNVGPVFKFSPLDPANSHSYNPLSFIRSEPDYIWEDSRLLADMMIVPSATQDPFWENMARDILTAAIAYISDNFPPEKRSISQLIDIMYGEGWEQMILSLKINVDVQAMRQTGEALEKMDSKMLTTVQNTAQSSLSAWQGQRVSKVTAASDWTPMALRNGDATIYICVNPNEIESYLSILRVFIAQHIRMLTNSLPDRNAAPVLFMLDELPRLKKMPPVDEALNVGRQYGIRLWMFAQSYGQLKESYNNAEGILNSCAVQTFMNLPLNDEMTHKLAQQLGFRDGPFDSHRKQLVEASALAGPEYKDAILVIATNTKPAKVLKHYAWQDEELVMRMK